ncbi:unnamed protein product, partial [Ilex paraguariensis]
EGDLKLPPNGDEREREVSNSPTPGHRVVGSFPFRQCGWMLCKNSMCRGVFLTNLYLHVDTVAFKIREALHWDHAYQ